MSALDPKLEQTAVNTIRFLAVDAIQKANSGHPGMPMGMADCAFVLLHDFMRHDPSDPQWPGRDRFVLSAGHGSMLLYAMLHLSGYDLSMEEIMRFRQWGSRTPGHPEYGVTAGVETTTGPLGQGFANGVGMALAAKLLGARLNTKEFSPVDWRVFGIVSDGDLMEGISSEAASLAGHLKLGNLNYLYDDNHICIEGNTNLTFDENVAGRFEAYGWHVQKIDGHDRKAVADALSKAVAEKQKPSIICARTHIAFGSPGKQDSEKAHGSPLGVEEVASTKKNLGWPTEPSFLVPQEVRDLFAEKQKQLKTQHDQWDTEFAKWCDANPDLKKLFDSMGNPQDAQKLLGEFIDAAGPMPAATRALSGKVLQKAAEQFDLLIGGSADLAPSNKTNISGGESIEPGSFSGRNMHFGIREHSMGSMMNGMALSGLIPYGGTFLVFADYMRPAIRMAALMELGTIYVFTHDSIFVGEDGPTHQPIEQLASLRCIPGLVVYRPADALETAAGWALAISRRHGPTALVLTRQKLSELRRPSGFTPEKAMDGAYVVVQEDSDKKAVVVATGSEVAPAAKAAGKLGIRCVSMPSVELFLEMSEERQALLIPKDWSVAVVEASHDPGWYRICGKDGLVVGIDRFGASAPASDVAEHLGMTEEAIEEKLRTWLQA